ncbi:MAG: response regulator [Gemmatimonadetes bacterium]|nr:response regulator [Gemmatimonadota bacterium]
MCEGIEDAGGVGTALGSRQWDLVLACCNGTMRVARETLALLEERDGNPPFIVLADPREMNAAVELMDEGAHDVLAKDDLRRLVLVVERELRRVRERDAHREKEVNLRSLFRAVEQSPAVVMVTDVEGKIEYINPRFVEITGYGLEEAVGQKPCLLKSGEHPEVFYRNLWEKISAGEVWRGEFHNRKKTGEFYWEAASISPVRDSDGEITHFVAVKEDITAHRREEILLQVSYATREAVWQMQEPGDIDPVLKALGNGLKALGIAFNGCGVNVVDRIDESSGVTFFSLKEDGEWATDKYEQADRVILRVWKSGELCYRRDLEAIDLFSEKKFLGDYFGPVRSVLDVPFSHGTLAVNSRDPDAFSEQEIASLQTLAGVLGEGFRRLDDLNALEEKAEQLRKMQRMEAVGRLAGGMAHDFNNLLTLINGNCQLLLRRGELSDEQSQLIEEVRKTGVRAGSLTRQLLVFSRRQERKVEILDLAEITRGMAGLLQRLLGEDIEMDIRQRGKTGLVEVDPGQMEQVIVNLAINARDAMPRGGGFFLETTNLELDQSYADQHMDVKSGSYVVLAVSDTGVGMDAETRSRVFEPFFTTKEPGEGTGLGLSTVYGIVHQSGGGIHVYSEQGQGTTFRIYLPRVQVEKKSESSGEREVDFPVLKGTETLLVVEDDETVLRAICRMMPQFGYTVLEACSGEEALRVQAEHDGRIDLLLTDAVMPGMSGTELAGEMVGRRPGIKVLYMSGYAESVARGRGVISAGWPFIEKPFTPEELGHKVRRALEQNQEN